MRASWLGVCSKCRIAHCLTSSYVVITSQSASQFSVFLSHFRLSGAPYADGIVCVFPFGHSFYFYLGDCAFPFFGFGEQCFTLISALISVEFWVVSRDGFYFSAAVYYRHGSFRFVCWLFGDSFVSEFPFFVEYGCRDYFVSRSCLSDEFGGFFAEVIYRQ